MAIAKKRVLKAPKAKPAPIEQSEQLPPESVSMLDDKTVQQLNAIIDEATALRDLKLEAAKKDFFKRIRSEAAELQLDLADLLSPQVASKKTGSVSAKYRSDSGEEWSGRGRMPTWVKRAESEGRNKESFLIDKIS